MGVDRASDHERCYVWVAPNWRLGELAVLEEHASDQLGFALWRAVARVRLWAESSNNRERLFSVRAQETMNRATRSHLREEEPDVASALAVFDRMHDVACPPSDSELIRACNQVIVWGERCGALETAMQFAEAAAAVDPDSAKLANTAGRVCRRAGERARAEVWYSRGIGLARASQNLIEYSSGYLGLAAVTRDGGEHYRAMKLIRRAGNAARRAGLRGKAAEAYQDALGVATLAGDFRRALHFAHRAAQVYPIHHKRLPAFGADLGFLLVCRGLYAPALSILPHVLQRMDRPLEQLIVWGTLARAAGGCDSHARYAEAMDHIRKGAYVYRSVGAGSLYSAAEGARLMGRWREAEELATEAITAARENDSAFVLELSETLLREVHQRLPGIPVHPRSDSESSFLRTLAAEMRLRLSRWRGPTWRPARKPGKPDDPQR
jgi:tetratricopeptide (TPR) repeat protein